MVCQTRYPHTVTECFQHGLQYEKTVVGFLQHIPKLQSTTYATCLSVHVAISSSAAGCMCKRSCSLSCRRIRSSVSINVWQHRRRQELQHDWRYFLDTGNDNGSATSFFVSWMFNQLLMLQFLLWCFLLCLLLFTARFSEITESLLRLERLWRMDCPDSHAEVGFWSVSVVVSVSVVSSVGQATLSNSFFSSLVIRVGISIHICWGCVLLFSLDIVGSSRQAWLVGVGMCFSCSDIGENNMENNTEYVAIKN